MPRSIVLAGCAIVVLAACASPPNVPESRVWSRANSNDGYASCPDGTTVTGGGFELKDKPARPIRVPIVVASRPDGNGWRVVCDDETTGEPSTACRAWALCASVLSR